MIKPSFRDLVLHILRKDLLHYRWALAGLIAAALVEVFLYGTQFGLSGKGWVKTLETVAGSGKFLIGFFLVVLVVQDEPLNDPEASCVARPIPRLAILAAKWFFCLLVIGLLNAGTAAVILALNGGFDRVLYPFIGIVGISIYIAFQILLASQTHSLPRYLGCLVALIIVLWIGGTVLAFSAFPLFYDKNPGLLPGDLNFYAVFWIQTLWWLLLGIGLGIFYYKTRRRLPLIGILLVGGLFALLLRPADFLGNAYPTSESRLANIEIVSDRLVQVSSGSSPATSNFTGYGLDIRLPGVDRRSDLIAELLWVSVTHNGESLSREFPQSQSGPLPPRGSDEFGAVYRLELFRIWDGDREKYGDHPLSVAFHLKVHSPVEHDLAELSLDSRRHLVNGGDRIAITGRSRSDDRLRIDLRHVIPNFAYEPKAAGLSFDLGRRYGILLRDEETGETFPSRNTGWSHSNFSGISVSESSLEFDVPGGLDESRSTLLFRQRDLKPLAEKTQFSQYRFPESSGNPDQSRQP